MEVYRIHMGKAKCAVDLGDGSERGEYVDQDYILAKMGRPHRSISLMYCYYPLDEGWPGRASVVHASLMSALRGIIPTMTISPTRADWAAAPTANRSTTCGRSGSTDRTFP